MRTITTEHRRRLLVARHRLGGGASSPQDATRAVVALHATDPASVYLSVLARCASCGVDDIATAMYGQRRLVRWLAMRRTLFVFEVGDIPVIQAAVSTPLAATLRSQLISRIRSNGSDPPIEGDVDSWVADVARGVERSLTRSGSATGAQLAQAEPRLATSIPARTRSQRTERVTSSMLTALSAEGRIVRSIPTGAWTSRHHRWEPVAAWWPDGLPHIDAELARQTLARRWLERFGPATVEDLQWWSGWNKTTTYRALSALPTEEVDLHGRVGITLSPSNDDVLDETSAPVAALLPALDPTPMGWKQRDWFLDVDPRELFDRAGNIGPTIWWDGRVVGSWAASGAGEVRTALRADIGSDGVAAVSKAAGRLHPRLGAATFVPAARTPLERSLTDSAGRLAP